MKWGHRLSAMESVIHDEPSLIDRLASMGPPPFGVKGGEMPRDAGSARGALEVLGRASSPIYLSIQPRSLFHPWDSGLGLTTDEIETHKAKVIAGKLGLSLATP